MTDTLRSDRPASLADTQERERDERVDHLLLTGLDHYFAGQHELAISVWTRVLFLNHGHARARAYIERARGAIAERQREGEELLHTGVEAFARGDAVTAQRLLMSAVARGAGSDEAFALLHRLTRAESSSPAARVARAPRDLTFVPEPDTRHDGRRPSRVRWVIAGAATGIAVALAAAWMWSWAADPWLARGTVTPTHSAITSSEPLPVPAVSEASMTRALALQAKGRLQESLAALEAIEQGDSSWAEAQALRATIQRQLRAGAGSPLPDGPSSSRFTRR